jgi:hypothetical protein
VNDAVSQCFTETWQFTELGPDNSTVVRREEETLRMRWTFRYEMRHLLRLCSFVSLKSIPISENRRQPMGKSKFGLR